MARRDLAEIKAGLDLAALVEQTTGQQVSYRRNIRCPWHEDHSPSLTIWPDGRWKCWGCGKQGDALDWLGYHLFGPEYNPQRHLAAVIDALGELDIKPAPYRKPERKIQTRLAPDLADKLAGRMSGTDYTYWHMEYAIPREVTERFKVGHTGRRWAIPWLYRGVLTAVKMRRDDRKEPDAEPKYISLKGSRYAAPFNVDALERGPALALICEDERSVMAASIYNLTAISAPAGSFRSEWTSFLAHVPEVVIVADADEAGAIGANRVQKAIRRGRIITPPVQEGDKDFADWHAAAWLGGSLPDVWEWLL